MAYDITAFVGVLNIEEMKATVMNTAAYFNRDDNDPYAISSSMIIIDELQILEDTDWTDQKIEGTCNSYAQTCADYSGVEVKAEYPIGINAALPICLPEASDRVAQTKLVSVLRGWVIAEIKYGYTEGVKVWTKVTDLPTEIATGGTTSTDGTTETTGTTTRPANALDKASAMVDKLIALDLNTYQYTLYVSAAVAKELRTLKQQCCNIETMTANMGTYAVNSLGLLNIIEIPAAANTGIDMALYYTPYQWLKVFCDDEPHVEENTGENIVKRGQYAIKGMETIGFTSIKPEWAFFSGTAGGVLPAPTPQGATLSGAEAPKNGTAKKAAK